MKTKLSLFWLLVSFLATNVFAGDIKDKIALGMSANSQKLYGDSFTGDFKFGGNPVNFRFGFMPSMYLESDLGYSQSLALLTNTTLKTEMFHAGLKLGYRFLHTKSINPITYLGTGVVAFRGFDDEIFGDGYVSFGGGIEAFPHKRFGLNFMADYRLTTGDDFDGSRAGWGRDNFLNLNAGVFFYLGNRNAGDLDKYLDQWRPDKVEPVDVSTVQPVEENPQKGARRKQLNDEMASRRQALLDSIAVRDLDIRLLKIKLTLLSQQAESVRANPEIFNTPGAVQQDNNYDSRFQTGLEFYRARNYGQAVTTFRTLLDEQPFHSRNGSCLYWLGESYFNAHQFPDAVDAFEQARGMIHPGEIERGQLVQLMLGLSYWNAGKKIDARVELKRLLQTSPGGEIETLTQEYLQQMAM